MRRRRFLASSLALAGLPQIAAAQSPRVFRIGWLVGGPADGAALFLEALRAGLADRGYIEGRNLVIEQRYGDDRPEPAVAVLAQELARLPVMSSLRREPRRAPSPRRSVPFRSYTCSAPIRCSPGSRRASLGPAVTRPGSR